MARTLGLERALHDAHRMGRGHAHGFVDHEPAVHVALLALALRLPIGLRSGDLAQVSSSVLLSRSRWTAGVRKSFSIRSASSNRSSIRNLISGANFRLTRCAISPRRNF